TSAVKDLVFEGFARVTKNTWAGLVRRTYANEDAFIEKFHILTAADINSMIIDLDADSEDENDDDCSTTDFEEPMFEDIIEIRDNEELDGYEESDKDNED